MLSVIPACAIARLDAASPDEALRALAGRLRARGAVAPGFADAITERERIFPTGLPTVVPTALPHTDPEHVLAPGLAVASLERPVAFGEMGGGSGASVEVELVVMPVLSDASAHLHALQRLIAALRDEDAVRHVLASRDDAQLERRVTAWLEA